MPASYSPRWRASETGNRMASRMIPTRHCRSLEKNDSNSKRSSAGYLLTCTADAGCDVKGVDKGKDSNFPPSHQTLQALSNGESAWIMYPK